MTEPPSMRVSDADRSATAERLRIAHDEGRLSLAEYDERVQKAYAAVVRSDLEPLTADLPAVRAPETSRVPDTREEDRAEVRTGWHQHWRPWAGVSVLLIGIWAITSLAAHEFIFFWPMFPIGFWGLGLLSSMFFGGGHGGHGRDEAKD